MLHTNKALDDLSESNNSILNKLKDVIEDVIKISEFNSEAKSLIEILKESEINLEMFYILSEKLVTMKIYKILILKV